MGSIQKVRYGRTETTKMLDKKTKSPVAAKPVNDARRLIIGNGFENDGDEEWDEKDLAILEDLERENLKDGRADEKQTESKISLRKTQVWYSDKLAQITKSRDEVVEFLAEHDECIETANKVLTKTKHKLDTHDYDEDKNVLDGAKGEQIFDAALDLRKTGNVYDFVQSCLGLIDVKMFEVFPTKFQKELRQVRLTGVKKIEDYSMSSEDDEDDERAEKCKLAPQPSTSTGKGMKVNKQLPVPYSVNWPERCQKEKPGPAFVCPENLKKQKTV